MTSDISSAIEEYLEVIYRLQKKNGVARTSALTEMLDVAPGTITNTVERLEKASLITHEPYKGVKLTDKGRKMALHVIRRHRLSERLLTDVLNVEWDRAHSAACKLEHGVSDEIAKRIEDMLGRPKTCPHGNPIPTEKGDITEERHKSILEMRPQEKGVVIRIDDESPSLLRYLDSLGIRPNVKIKVVEIAPFEGPLTVKIEGRTHAMSRKVARLISVRNSVGKDCVSRGKL